MKSTGSFIPSGAASAAKPKRVRKIYIFTYIIYVFFTVTLVTALGIFAYTQYLDTQLAAAKEDLVAKQANFDANALAEVSALEQKISQATSIFNNQVSLFRVLQAIEEVVLRSVSITGFSYTDDMQAVTLKMSANLPDFNAAVYQRTVLSNHPLFAEATVDNIAYGENQEGGETVIASNALTFDITVPLDTEALRPTVQAAVTPSAPVVEEVEEVADEMTEEGDMEEAGTSTTSPTTNDI